MYRSNLQFTGLLCVAFLIFTTGRRQTQAIQYMYNRAPHAYCYTGDNPKQELGNKKEEPQASIGAREPGKSDPGTGDPGTGEAGEAIWITRRDHW